MQLIATDKVRDLGAMLEGYECPAILVSADYQILATNENYREAFGEIELDSVPRCYEVSHGYTKPCDQSGEDCPLGAAVASGHKERVLHIHQTPSRPRACRCRDAADTRLPAESLPTSLNSCAQCRWLAARWLAKSL
jgi:hypothetical protein